MISTVRRLIEEIERDLSRVKLKKLKGILNGLLDEIEAERRFRAELVKKEDFSELKAIVKELVEAQKRTETSIERLTDAQKKSDERLTRVEAAIERLTDAQKKSDERLTRVEAAIEKLTEAHTRFERTFESKIGALGARWGLITEISFRKAIQTLLEDVGFKVEHYLKYDTEGKVFGHPDQIEIDMIIRDRQVTLVEIKSSLSKGDVSLFKRKIDFYREKEKGKVDKKLIIAPFVEPGADKLASLFGMEICTNVNELE